MSRISKHLMHIYCASICRSMVYVTHLCLSCLTSRKFRTLFPELVDMHKKNGRPIEQSTNSGETDGIIPEDERWSMDSILMLLVGILMCIVAIISVAKSQ
jgi:hypothetical protein